MLSYPNPDALLEWRTALQLLLAGLLVALVVLSGLAACASRLEFRFARAFSNGPRMAKMTSCISCRHAPKRCNPAPVR